MPPCPTLSYVVLGHNTAVKCNVAQGEACHFQTVQSRMTCFAFKLVVCWMLRQSLALPFRLAAVSGLRRNTTAPAAQRTAPVYVALPCCNCSTVFAALSSQRLLSTMCIRGEQAVPRDATRRRIVVKINTVGACKGSAASLRHSLFGEDAAAAAAAVASEAEGAQQLVLSTDASRAAADLAEAEAAGKAVAAQVGC
jgi:hypothetical protein